MFSRINTTANIRTHKTDIYVKENAYAAKNFSQFGVDSFDKSLIENQLFRNLTMNKNK